MNWNEINKLTPKVIGSIDVDSGCIWIGDPSYVIHKQLPSEIIGSDWDTFTDLLGNDVYTSFSHKSGNEGLGICTSTKYGDGTYQVIGFFENHSPKPSFIIIDFVGWFTE